jgi:flavin reductase (DIM6/NTAB) family NADH-FMN oxidoreductase RutF
MHEKQAVKTFHYLLHPYNTSLVTCCDASGTLNIITIAWLIPTSVNPPMVVMSVGPTRHSYSLIQETKEFVINVAPYEIAQQVLFCGRRSGREVDKFAKTGLTSGEARQVRPPIIQECVAHLECRVVRDIEAGDHHLIIGEVLAAYANPEVLDEKGLYQLGSVHPLLHLGQNTFTSTQPEAEKLSLPT